MMKKKPTQPKEFKSPVSDWLDQRAENNAVDIFRWIIRIGIAGLGYAIYDIFHFGKPAREFLIGLPIGALFLSLAILSHFEVQYRMKIIYSILITSFSIFISFVIGSYYGAR